MADWLKLIISYDNLAKIGSVISYGKLAKADSVITLLSVCSQVQLNIHATNINYMHTEHKYNAHTVWVV